MPQASAEAMEPSERPVPKALHPLFRYPLVIALGAVIAGATFYLVKRLGY